MSNPRYPEEFKIQTVNQVTEKKLPVAASMSRRMRWPSGQKLQVTLWRTPRPLLEAPIKSRQRVKPRSAGNLVDPRRMTLLVQPA